MIKTQSGRFLAPEKIENAYAESKMISQVYVHGDPFADYLVAIINPDEIGIRQWAATKSIKCDDLQDLCNREDTKLMIAEELKKINEIRKLHWTEKIEKFYISASQFNMDEGTLTVSHKLKRKEVAQLYKDQIAEMVKRT